MPGTRPPTEMLHGSGKGVGKRSGGKENTGAVHHNGDAAPSSSGRPAVDRSAVKFPLELGTLVECRFSFDNTYLLARVIDIRAVSGGAPLDGAPPEGHAEWEYYVHYRNKNRRNDAWVALSKLNLDTVVPPEPLDPSDPKGKKRRVEEEHSEEEGQGHEIISAQAAREHEELTRVKNVERVELGRYEMETWYFSPLPPELGNVRRLYFCEYDLQFFKRREEMLSHLRKVRVQHPPGTEIYRHRGISMFEVDGRKAKIYCQNLCLLAKLFLDHKTLHYDIDLFLFYVMCECDERGAHIVGYFSKEKTCEDNNLACILTLPAYQRRGFGKFLISFSYELSKIEGKAGTPERPLSDLGLVSYRGYWTRVLLGILRDHEGPISIKELSEMTRINQKDITHTLQDHLNMIQYVRGQHVIYAAPHVIEAHLRRCGSPGLVVEPTKIVWTPHTSKE